MLLKRLGLILFLFLEIFFFEIYPATALSQSTQTQQTEAIRKTSDPYTGDLSIFESPGRDERLQINRVMDILELLPERRSLILERDQAGFRSGRRSGLEMQVSYTRSTSIPMPSVTSNREYGKRTSTM